MPADRMIVSSDFRLRLSSAPMLPTNTAKDRRISEKAGSRSSPIHNNVAPERSVARRDMRSSSTMSIMKIRHAQTTKAPKMLNKKRLAT